ncbi:MAG: hypothetical protein MHM6MM_000886 [Cercozoa sp. M6MM]
MMAARRLLICALLLLLTTLSPASARLKFRGRPKAKDYYDRLGLNKGASAEDLKKAFKSAAREFHPDRNQDRSEEAAEEFKRVVEAYEVLNDEKKRNIYDRFGEEGLKQQQGQPQQGGFPGGAFRGSNVHVNFGRMGGMGGVGGMGDVGDIFSTLFGGGARGFRQQQQRRHHKKHKPKMTREQRKQWRERRKEKRARKRAQQKKQNESKKDL